ncbi:MAG: hypothetical protein ACK5AZ_10290 [Bryobacteraceae bacterium]
MPAGGGSARLVTRIADTRGYARPLAWWPDGESLLVRDARPDGVPILRVFLSGSPSVPVTVPPPFETDAYIAVSPDGKHFAFARDRPGSGRLVCIAPAAGDTPDASNDPCIARFPNVRGLAWRQDSRGIYASDRSALYY